MGCRRLWPLCGSSLQAHAAAAHAAAAAVRAGPPGLRRRQAHAAGLQLLKHSLRGRRRLVRDHEQALLVVGGADVALPLRGAAAGPDEEGAAEPVGILEPGV